MALLYREERIVATGPLRQVSIPVALGLAFKIALLAIGAVPFNSDEAIVALMARHILQGERPAFFYGQAYMGSLDAYFIAGACALMGESVLAVRAVQVVLFLAVLLTAYGVALRFTGSHTVALLTALLLACPPVLLSLYTTATLGGYGEALLAGNLLLWWGHRLGHEDAARRKLWMAWGLVAGLGFWAFGLTLVYLAPVALWLLWRLRIRRWREYLLAALAFALGSLPWWLGNLGQVDIALAELAGSAVKSTATAGSLIGNIGMRVFNLLVLGLPALFGLRFPWSVEGPPLWLAAPVLMLYLGSLGYAMRRRDGGSARSGRLLLWGVWATLCLGFVLTPFGGDPSGRYFLPLYLPLFVFCAEALAALRARIGRWAWVLLGVVLAFNLVGTVQAALKNPPGATTQFEEITQVDHRYDAELISFLREHGGTRGYANYWVAYPIAFLSQEEIILVPHLPYKADLRYTFRDDRYLPYTQAVAQAAHVVYVTTNHSLLDALLREGFARVGVTFHEAQIGSYHVFYGLSRRVSPREVLPPSMTKEG
jgi:4-amino-4-deoxy-L-arabinose transferase-like glycosyltransferase